MKTLTQDQISLLCNNLSDSIPEILKRLNIGYVEHPNRYSFPCPVHGGDNPEGCSLFIDGEDVVGNWKCWTHGCEQDFAENIFGFVRGCLSFQKGEMATLSETYDFCSKIAKNIKQTTYREPDKQTKLIDIFLQQSIKSESTLSREEIRSKIQIPAQYYLDRGYSEDILDIFDIGLCIEKNRPMYKRVVVPVYDIDYNYVGCVGRSTNEAITPKWLHSRGFKKSHLYGLNLAKKYISDHTLFLLEGQGDVWRMHEAGYKNSVSIFGSSLVDEQLILLEEIGIMNIIILTDYDEAGHKAAQQIQRKCGRRFNYFRPTLSGKDVGDMTVEQLKQELGPQL